jgi:hypothetical protein
LNSCTQYVEMDPLRSIGIEKLLNFEKPLYESSRGQFFREVIPDNNGRVCNENGGNDSVPELPIPRSDDGPTYLVGTFCMAEEVEWLDNIRVMQTSKSVWPYISQRSGSAWQPVGAGYV